MEGYRIDVKLASRTPLIQGRFHGLPKLNRELADAYERRTWPFKMHVLGGFTVGGGADGGEMVLKEGWQDFPVVLPGVAFKRSLDEAVKYQGRQVPGKGKSTYTKHFEAGAACLDYVPLLDGNGKQIRAGDVEPQQIFTSTTGERNGGKRVHRLFPCIPQWTASVSFEVMDEIITPAVFIEHLKIAGMLIGVGSFRVRNGGFCGRYIVESFTKTEIVL